jgi:hypothetical protein
LLQHPKQIQGAPYTAARVIKVREVDKRTFSFKPSPFQLANALRSHKQERSFEDDDVDYDERIDCQVIWPFGQWATLVAVNCRHNSKERSQEYGTTDQLKPPDGKNFEDAMGRGFPRYTPGSVGTLHLGGCVDVVGSLLGATRRNWLAGDQATCWMFCCALIFVR